MFPEESVRACLDVGAKLAIPVHHGAFVLSDHAWNEPTYRFEKAAKENELNYLLPELNKLICL